MSEPKNDIIIDLIKKHIDVNNKNKFDLLMQDIEKYIEGGTAHNMAQLKEISNNKKKKGDLFECFCYLYLQKILEHDEVWFYKDFPKELKDQFHLPKNDYGIDLISKKVLDIMRYNVNIENHKTKHRLFHGNHYLLFMLW